MNGKTLTIAIPAYNVEKYLEQCVSSFLVESVLPDMEILIINDGSTDSTEKIGMRYQNQYPESIKVITKENGGHGSAINEGIRYATGKYFKIVDGDDWINTDKLVDFIGFLKSTDADVVATNFCKVDHVTQQPWPEERQERTFGNIEYGRVYQFDEICSEVFIKMHSMTIRPEIFREHQIRITEHQFYVDSEFIFYPIPYVETIAFYQPDLYMYRLGLNGQSMDIKKMQINMNHHLNILANMLKYYGRLDISKISEEKKKYLQNSIGRILTSQFKIFISFPLGFGMRKKMKKLDLLIKNRYPDVYGSVSNKSVWMLRKSGYLLFPIAVLSFRLTQR